MVVCGFFLLLQLCVSTALLVLLYLVLLRALQRLCEFRTSQFVCCLRQVGSELLSCLLMSVTDSRKRENMASVLREHRAGCHGNAAGSSPVLPPIGFGRWLPRETWLVA